jgi:hypothetical protein
MMMMMIIKKKVENEVSQIKENHTRENHTRENHIRENHTKENQTEVLREDKSFLLFIGVPIISQISSF